jgi:hypothetical protein
VEPAGLSQGEQRGADDHFGYSVAISGETVVVGALDEDSSATGGQSDNSALDAGAAYIYFPKHYTTITTAVVTGLWQVGKQLDDRDW